MNKNVRYTVHTAPAYFSLAARQGINQRVPVGSFARKDDALRAAAEALDAFRVTQVKVDRERFTRHVDPLFGRESEAWEMDGEVKTLSRWLRPDEFLTPEEEASR
jgi:hypothetical protein